MSGLLAGIYSAGDTAKRKLRGLLDDPIGTIQQQIGLLNDNAGKFNQLHSQATQESVNAIKSGGNEFGPANVALSNKLADAYNPAGITVWHGSPHKFAKFDSSKIGTGEGAQAYGHGLYLAESPDVAGQYQKTLAHKAFATMDKVGPNNYRVTAPDGSVLVDGEYLGKATRIKDAFDANAGNLYKVDLPDEHVAKMLDWDKPLSQQPHVQRAMLNQDDGWKAYASKLDPESRAVAEDMVLGTKPVHGDEATSLWESLLKKFPSLDHNEIHDVRWRMSPDMNDGEWLQSVLSGNGAVGSGVRGGGGADLYNSLGGGDAAAQQLRQLGIPGIRYLDGGSRGAGGGTSNFVVFPGNEGLLSILERNGQPIK